MFSVSYLLNWGLVTVIVMGSLWTITTHAQQPSGWACQLPAQSGRIIVLFNNKLIRSSQTENLATDGPVPTTIAAGTYGVTLESFNTHSAKNNPTQPHEEYFLILSNNQTTASISDLPDNQDSLIEKVHTNFIITDDITSVTARSTKWPEPAGPKEINSIIPVCAAFDLVEQKELTPTPIPAPTLTVAPTGGGPANETDCCPGPDKVTSTPTPKLYPLIKGITTTSPTPTPKISSLQRLPSAGPSIANLIVFVLLLIATTLASRLAYKSRTPRANSR